MIFFFKTCLQAEFLVHAETEQQAKQQLDQRLRQKNYRPLSIDCMASGIKPMQPADVLDPNALPFLDDYDGGQ